MSGASERICVVGGGILGQVLALRLAKMGHTVTLCEAARSLGGLVEPWTVGDVSWDKFYHVILPADTRTIALLEEIGLKDALIWRKSRTGFFADGRLSPLDSGLDYLRLPIIGLIDKLRLAFMLTRAARISDGRTLEQMPVSDWLIRTCGQRTYERLWRPLLRAKLGDNATRVSAAFIWATIRRLYLARSAGAKTEVLGFVDGGYDRVLRALERALHEAGVEILTNCPVSEFTQRSGGFDGVLDGRLREFDRVVSTIPATATSRLCKALDHDIRDKLDNVVYQGILCASVVIDHPLSANYLTYLADEDLPFTGIVEMSALTGTERFGGKNLVYLPRYATQDDDFWEMDDAEVEGRFLEGLVRVHPDLDSSSILAFKLARVRNVMAVPTLNYTQSAPPVVTNVPGFNIVNSAQIVDGTLNVDATLQVVERALPLLRSASRATQQETAA